MTDSQCVDYLENICKMFVRGCENCEGQALEYQQMYISAIRYAIAKVQSSEAKKGHTTYINHVNDNGHNIADCSVCGHAMQWHDEDEDGVPRFCWFCGAKIDGVED